jgi:hypothetical protein
MTSTRRSLGYHHNRQMNTAERPVTVLARPYGSLDELVQGEGRRQQSER